jgi:hypothetical protein
VNESHSLMRMRAPPAPQHCVNWFNCQPVSNNHAQLVFVVDTRSTAALLSSKRGARVFIDVQKSKAAQWVADPILLVFEGVPTAAGATTSSTPPPRVERSKSDLITPVNDNDNDNNNNSNNNSNGKPIARNARSVSDRKDGNKTADDEQLNGARKLRSQTADQPVISLFF